MKSTVFQYVKKIFLCLDKPTEEDDSETFLLLDQTTEQVVPDHEHDRRKGLGPLQVGL